MSLKLKAFTQVLVLIGSTFICSYAVQFIFENVPRHLLINAMQIGFFSGMVYMIYRLLLTRLEGIEKIKDLTKKVDN